MERKEVYEEPEMEIVTLEMSDVITESYPGQDDEI